MSRLPIISILAFLLTACGGGPDPDAGMDATAEVDAGPPAVCGDEVVSGDEACDDGNTDGGDGCSADCASDETCGNGTLELDEVCDDGNGSGGDGCSPDCASDESCGNGLADFGVGELCDDGNMVDGDGCSADCASDEFCPNGIVDIAIGETCDDDNARLGDGCDASCQIEACSIDSDCDDANACNGVETCATGVCAAGTPIAEGDVCGAGATRDICVAGACVTSACGDRFLDPGATPPETCDDGDTMGGDGCSASCQLESCTDASACDDMNACTAGHRCDAGTCVLGTFASDGSICDADAMGATRDLCLFGRCVRSACGDGYVDSGASPREQCDDGNTMSGDGCEADCTIPPVPITAYRLVSATLVDPHIYVEVGAGCSDITSTVNSLIATSFADYALDFVGLFQPLDLTSAGGPLEVDFEATCGAGTPRDTCAPGLSPVATTANNTLPAAMTCLSADPAVLNPSYTGTVNTPRGPCFVTPEQTFTINLSGVAVRLERARMAATYGSGATPARLVNGVIIGFLGENEARMIHFEAGLPLVGGDSVYQHLADGGAVDSACEAVSGFTTDDSDTVAGSNGFVFHINFVAELVDWTP